MIQARALQPVLVVTRWILVIALLIAPAGAARAQWGFGAEGNDRQTYAWLTRYHPIALSPGNQVVVWGTVSWRRYEPGPSETLSGPGLAAGATYRRSTQYWSGGLGAGWDVRWLERDSNGMTTNETSSGPALLGDFSARVAERTSFNAGATYWGADEWVSSSANLLYQVNPSLRAGPEAGFDGNGDLQVTRYGGIVGIPQGRRWLYLRAGQARTEDRVGNVSTQPYFSAGIAGSF